MSFKVIDTTTHKECGHYHAYINRARTCGNKIPIDHDLRVVLAGDHMGVGARRSGVWGDLHWTAGIGEVFIPLVQHANK